MADIGFGAARPDLVVIRQVNVEDEFFGNGTEGGRFPEGLAIARVGAIDRTNFET